LAGRARKSRQAWFLRVALLVLGGVWLASLAYVFAYRFWNPPFTHREAVRWVRGGQWGNFHLRAAGWRPLEAISPHLRRAVLAAEDQRFAAHHGLDFKELRDAVGDFVGGRGRRGASTITMQVARTVFLWPEREWSRKLVEIYTAIVIETCWSKRRILEVYLNTVDWGPGVRGAEAAARRYFGLSAAELTAGQAALLAAVLPSPHRWSPSRPSAYLLQRQARILKDIHKMPLL